MLGYFPQPYKNESIYSLAARYASHMGIISKRKAIKDTFNIVQPIMYEDYISHINILVSKIKHFSNEYTEDYFLYNHTIYPLYAPFMSGKPVTLGSLDIYVKSRKRFIWDIPEKENFYYCSECVKEEIENYGECFWNRIFQVPGVMVCSKHKKTLFKLNINIEKNPLNKFIMPDLDMDLSEEVELEGKTFEFMLEISGNVEYFFKHKVDATSYRILYEKYYEFIKISGIASQPLQIKSKLADLVLSRFNEETLDVLNSNPLKNDWLSHLSVERLKNIHPIRHILLMMTLNESVQNFLNTTPHYQPFGIGPWPCMNPLSKHYLEEVISNINITHNTARNEFQGLFLCSCGFAYVLYEGEKSPYEIKAFHHRVKAKGKEWEREFDILVSKGISVKDIAEITNISKGTVLRRIREGHNYVEIGRKKKKQEFKEKISIQEKADKEEWFKLTNKFPNYSRSELRVNFQNLYERLARNDRKWLNLNLPNSKRGKGKTSEEINHKRDLSLLKKAKNILNNWPLYEKQAGKIIKRTQYTLYSRIGINKKFEEKYPISVKYISTFIESKEDYQIRLIDQCIENHFTDEEIKKYKILMISGLRNLEPKAEKHLEEIMQVSNKKF